MIDLYYWKGAWEAQDSDVNIPALEVYMDPQSASDNNHNGNEENMVRSDNRNRNRNINRIETPSVLSVTNRHNREAPPLLVRDTVGAGGDANSNANIPALSPIPDDNDGN